MQHPAHLWRVVDLDRVADPTQADRAQRVELALVGAVARLALGDFQSAHDVGSSACASELVGSGSASAPACRSLDPPLPLELAAGAEVESADSVRPSTWLTESPRSSATSSGVRSASSPAIVALTRLIGFCEPSDFERMSWIPASSSTARTPPPAITPVPGAAGFKNTRPAPNTPVT